LKVTAPLALSLLSAWMILKIRFCTLKFYLKNYISRGRKEKKKKSSRKHVTARTTLKRGPNANHLCVRANFSKVWKLLDSPTLLKAWTPGLKKIESLQVFVKFFYNCYVVGKRTYLSLNNERVWR